MFKGCLRRFTYSMRFSCLRAAEMLTSAVAAMRGIT